MFEKIELTRMAQAMAADAGARLGVIARNVANADVPGYKALTLPDFAETYAAQDAAMRATRPGHLGGAMAPTLPRPRENPGNGSPNGNTVSLEEEMVNSAGARQQNDMALAIYRATSDILRASLGRPR
jgi:flagellar basal-body rod protein FlgB